MIGLSTICYVTWYCDDGHVEDLRCAICHVEVGSRAFWQLWLLFHEVHESRVFQSTQPAPWLIAKSLKQDRDIVSSHDSTSRGTSIHDLEPKE